MDPSSHILLLCFSVMYKLYDLLTFSFHNEIEQYLVLISLSFAGVRTMRQLSCSPSSLVVGTAVLNRAPHRMHVQILIASRSRLGSRLLLRREDRGTVDCKGGTSVWPVQLHNIARWAG